MTQSQLALLLKELEPFFGCKLEPDSHNSCLIRFGVGLTLQIEMSRGGLLLLGCRLGVLHAGKYREALMKQALKANELSPPSDGVFGFSYKSAQLILFVLLDPSRVSEASMALFLPQFLTKAKLWKEAIEKSELPVLPVEESSLAPGGLFGLIS